VGALVVACGDAGAGPEWTRVPAVPTRDDLDPLLAGDPERVVVLGTDADLAAVVLRLLRTDRLAVPVGFVPAGRSAVARLWGLPSRRADVPLVRDDSGGVLLGRGTVGPVHGEAYCDDQLALRGRASSIEVSPHPAGVLGTVHSGLLRRRRCHGRAFQIGCHATSVTCDGVTHPREVKRWTWYRHTEDLQAVVTTFGGGH